LSFLVKSIPPFLTLFGHIEEQSGISRELLQTCLAITVGIEGCFQAAQSERRVLEHLATPLNRRFFEFFIGDYAIHKTHFKRLLCVVLPAEKPDFSRLFLSYNAR